MAEEEEKDQEEEEDEREGEVVCNDRVEDEKIFVG